MGIAKILPYITGSLAFEQSMHLTHPVWRSIVQHAAVLRIGLHRELNNLEIVNFPSDTDCQKHEYVAHLHTYTYVQRTGCPISSVTNLTGFIRQHLSTMCSVLAQKLEAFAPTLNTWFLDHIDWMEIYSLGALTTYSKCTWKAFQQLLMVTILVITRDQGQHFHEQCKFYHHQKYSIFWPNLNY